ncbi:MAG: bifunctional folylpolyglutamate synthase/dihydrofolate synthase [Verrucomicrobiota bacterium]
MPTPDFSSYPAVRDFLFGLRNTGMKYGIERMARFVELLGHPQARFPSVHVAGTNGKGSVCAMLETIYRRAGLSTGLYTSPHLVRQGERIQIDRAIYTEAQIVEAMRRIYPAAAQMAASDPEAHPSFFEFMTAMAFDAFAEARVDVALVEVGLGGRLDATNVLTPRLSIITSISLDHTDILGDTIEQIAREKAGIVKPGVPVLIGRLPEAAEAVVRAIAAERGAPLHRVEDRFGRATADYPETNLRGEHQRWNAGVALRATELLAEQFPVEAETVRMALQEVDWPGRWQVLEASGRKIVLDAAHNPEGAQMLDKSLRKLVAEEGRRPLIVAGVLGRERAQHLMPVLAEHAREIYLIKSQQPRASSFDELKAELPEPARARAQSAQAEALFGAASTSLGQPGDTIVVTGSLYLIGEVCSRLSGIDPNTGASLQDTP